MTQRDNSIKRASEYTIAHNRDVARYFGLDTEQITNEEVALAQSGKLLDAGNQIIPPVPGRAKPVWNMAQYAFLRSKAAQDTVNPSLWLNARACAEAGVFTVVPDKIYQVRGLDIANLTIVRSRTGWIVLDTTTSIQTAQKCLELLEEALKEPVKDRIRAVIISHSHSDHFGGVRGVVTPEQAGHMEEGKIPIIVPAGFDEASVKENVFAGTAMSRRGKYQFGAELEAGPRGKVSVGLGIDMSFGMGSYLPPTDFIEEDQVIIIDGLAVEFQLTPGTEAPAEMNNYFPEYRAFWAAENCTATLHNLYPIRGAKLRDAANWWYFTEIALEKYGKRSDVVFQSHHWPHANTKENPHAVEDYLRNTAAVYKFIHDQTLLYANQGKTAKEIGKAIRLPEFLEKNWYTRPYYGSLEINAREVYEFYLGFYNGNPNDLNPLTEVEDAQLFVDYAGGAKRVLELAERDFEQGNYRRAAKAAGNVVYTDPTHLQARYLTADAFEQLGYQAESSIWRNAYLMGAAELRNGTFHMGVNQETKRKDILGGMNAKMLLDYLGIVTDGNDLAQEDTALRLLVQTDNGTEKEFLLHVYHGALLYHEGPATGIHNYARLTEEALRSLITKQLDQVLPEIDTNVPDILRKLEGAVVDLSAYTEFPLMGLRD